MACTGPRAAWTDTLIRCSAQSWRRVGARLIHSNLALCASQPMPSVLPPAAWPQGPGRWMHARVQAGRAGRESRESRERKGPAKCMRRVLPGSMSNAQCSVLAGTRADKATTSGFKASKVPNLPKSPNLANLSSCSQPPPPPIKRPGRERHLRRGLPCVVSSTLKLLLPVCPLCDSPPVAIATCITVQPPRRHPTCPDAWVDAAVYATSNSAVC